MNTNFLIIAKKEWSDGWRNQWISGVTIIFALMALGITWFGSSTQGQSGFVSLDATIASLSSLTVLVIPLIALLLGFDAFVGEQEQGTLNLLLTYPISKKGLVFGKFLGQWSILLVAIGLGFGSAFAVLAYHEFSTVLLFSALLFLTSAALLGAAFLAMAHLISLFVNEKSQAAGLALLSWFFFTLLYDMALLALLTSTSGWLNSNLLKSLLMLNPTDLFRIINLAQLEAQGAGVLASLQNLQFNLPSLYAFLVLWAVVSMGLAILALNRKKI